MELEVTDGSCSEPDSLGVGTALAECTRREEMFELNFSCVAVALGSCLLGLAVGALYVYSQELPFLSRAG